MWSAFVLADSKIGKIPVPVHNLCFAVQQKNLIIQHPYQNRIYRDAVLFVILDTADHPVVRPLVGDNLYSASLCSLDSLRGLRL